MAAFEFSARDSSGQTQTGVLDAPSAAMVAAQLRQRGWRVVRIRQQSAETMVPKRGWLDSLRAPRGVQVELSLRQMAVMLRGGISLLAAMQTIATQSDSKAVRLVYGGLIEQVQQGRPLSEAMESQPGFPDYLIRLVQVGERTGIQETALVRAADMMRTRRETFREVVSALSYPLIVLLAAGGATAYMVSTLIPKLTTLLEGLGKPLPPMTQSLVTMSNFFQTWGTTAAVGLGLLVIVFIVAYMSQPGRLAIDRWVLRIPVIGKILRLSGTLTFSQTLGTLISSGVTVLDSLVTVQQMHANRYLAQLIQRSRDAIMRGNNLADTLRVRHAYMPLLATMTAVGEASGNLDDVLEQVSEFHTAQLKSLIRTLSAWMTPAIMVAVGVVVGYVYIAFFIGLFAVAR
jgi:type IV pilus assembly protein PilC